MISTVAHLDLEELQACRVVEHQHVDVAIAVVVETRDATALGGHAQAPGGGLLAEGAVAAVDEQARGHADVLLRGLYEERLRSSAAGRRSRTLHRWSSARSSSSRVR